MLKRKIPVYKSETEIAGLRAAGAFNAELMDVVRPQVQPGITTGEINRIVEEYTRDHGHIPATLGYKGFPKSCCTSVNEVVCHGIPGDYPLANGDIINVDLTSIVDGWYGDQSETFLVGDVTDDARQLVQVTFEALWVGIDSIKPYGRVIDIGEAIYRFAKGRGFEVVREYQGHGLGREFHQEPGVPHYPDSRSVRDVIPPGVCFTIEPMLNEGTWRTIPDSRDGWTVYTKDRKLSAQFEHTLLMTEKGPEVLTLTKNGPQRGHQF